MLNTGYKGQGSQPFLEGSSTGITHEIATLISGGGEEADFFVLMILQALPHLPKPHSPTPTLVSLDVFGIWISRCLPALSLSQKKLRGLGDKQSRHEGRS